MARLQNKTALITGGTSGIGLETARQFIAEGARVAITGSSAKSVEAARAEFDDKVLVIQADAGNAAGQKAVANAIKRGLRPSRHSFRQCRCGRVRPARAMERGSLRQVDRDQRQGSVLPHSGAAPGLFETGFDRAQHFDQRPYRHAEFERLRPYQGRAADAGKDASGELIGRGIRVNAVSPGPIATPLYDKLGMSKADSKAMAAQIQSQIPVGRFGDAGEVAKTIIFLASDEAAYIVGSELVIDGGMSNL